MMCRRGGQAGSILPLLAVVLGLVGLVGSIVALEATLQVRDARADWAADATARAAAGHTGPLVAGVLVVPGADGEGSPSPETDALLEVATKVAEANGAVLVSLEIVDRSSQHLDPDRSIWVPESEAPLAVSPVVIVTVTVGGVQGQAAAARMAIVGP